MKIPVFVVSGFLGAGKTTLLRQVLRAGELSGSLLLVNEIGALGVDDRLIRLEGLPTMLLADGCICCTANEELGTLLHKVLAPAADSVPMERIVIETTGLADPLGVLSTIAASPRLAAQLCVQMVITVVDVLGVASEEAGSAEYLRQIELADAVLLTKTDLAETAQIEHAKAMVASSNPLCAIHVAGALSLTDILQSVPALRADRIARRWLPTGEPDSQPRGRLGRGLSNTRHSVPARSFCIRFDERLDWMKLSAWLSLMLHTHGARLLRVKGFLSLQQGSTPVLVNCVRHLAYLPEHVETHVGDDDGSFLVFIVRDLSPESIFRSLLTHVAPGTRVRLLESTA